MPWSHTKFDGLSWINENAAPFSSASSNKLYRETATLARLMEIVTTKNADFGEEASSLSSLRRAKRWYTSQQAKDIVRDYLEDGLSATRTAAATDYLALA